jgi:hypothetical protein
MNDQEADALADEFLAHMQMEGTVEYLARGRRHQALNLCDLNDQWTAAFLDAFPTGRRERVIDMDDLASELRLRGLDPPYDRVADEVAVMKDRLRQMEPAAAAQMLEAVRQFLVERSKPKN